MMLPDGEKQRSIRNEMEPSQARATWDLEEIAQLLQYEGWAYLRGALSVAEAQTILERMESVWNDESLWDQNEERDYFRGGVSVMRLFEHDKIFADLANISDIVRIVRSILGGDCHLVSQNGLRSRKGQGIVRWHIDDALFFPRAMNSGRSWDSISLPTYSLSVMFALSDIDDVSDGPTQVVPKSHRSGEHPPKNPNPNEVHSITAKAGDAYIFNSQIWHRGAQIFSEKQRYVVTNTYGRRFLSQRFFPFVDYKLPSYINTSSDAELRRLFGCHGKGPYG